MPDEDRQNTEVERHLQQGTQASPREKGIGGRGEETRQRGSGETEQGHLRQLVLHLPFSSRWVAEHLVVHHTSYHPFRDLIRVRDSLVETEVEVETEDQLGRVRLIWLRFSAGVAGDMAILANTVPPLMLLRQ